MNKLSFAITCCNETKEILKLLCHLDAFIQARQSTCEFEIVILHDNWQSDPKRSDLEQAENQRCFNAVYDIVERINTQKKYSAHLSSSSFSEQYNSNFASWKNFLNLLCKGNWIFNIDADEIPTVELLEYVSCITEYYLNTDSFNEIDVIRVPRKNTVSGLTADQAWAKWGWGSVTVGNETWFNWPDYQDRIYKKSEHIIWAGKVHEKLHFLNHYSNIPSDLSLDCKMYLIHEKDLERQTKQNEFYQTL